MAGLLDLLQGEPPSGGILALPSWLQNPQDLLARRGLNGMSSFDLGPGGNPTGFPLPPPAGSVDPPPAAQPTAGTLLPSAPGPFGGMFAAPAPASAAGGIGPLSNGWLGYLAGALQGGNLGQSIGRGLQGYMVGQQADVRQQTPAATYRALRAAGVPHATAQAAALNPDVLKAIAKEHFGTTKAVQVGARAP
jgi:hypothetical protein